MEVEDNEEAHAPKLENQPEEQAAEDDGKDHIFEINSKTDPTDFANQT